jgi:hypothetical protein
MVTVFCFPHTDKNQIFFFDFLRTCAKRYSGGGEQPGKNSRETRGGGRTESIDRVLDAHACDCGGGDGGDYDVTDVEDYDNNDNNNLYDYIC